MDGGEGTFQNQGMLRGWWQVSHPEKPFFLAPRSHSRGGPEPARPPGGVHPAGLHPPHHPALGAEALEEGPDWSGVALEVHRWACWARGSMASSLRCCERQLWSQGTYFKLGSALCLSFPICKMGIQRPVWQAVVRTRCSSPGPVLGQIPQSPGAPLPYIWTGWPCAPDTIWGPRSQEKRHSQHPFLTSSQSPAYWPGQEVVRGDPPQRGFLTHS